MSHVSDYASPFLSEIFSECVVVQNLRHRGTAQLSEYLISSALIIMVWITRSNSRVMIGLIDGGDANVCAHVIDLQ